MWRRQRPATISRNIFCGVFDIVAAYLTGTGYVTVRRFSNIQTGDYIGVSCHLLVTTHFISMRMLAKASEKFQLKQNSCANGLKAAFYLNWREQILIAPC